MKRLVATAMTLFLSFSIANSVETPVQKGNVKQGFSDTMKYAARGFKSCTDTCIVGKDSYQKVCEAPLTKAWCKKNCEHKKFMMNGKEMNFNVEAKCKMTANKVGDIITDEGKKIIADIGQFIGAGKSKDARDQDIKDKAEQQKAEMRAKYGAKK